MIGQSNHLHYNYGDKTPMTCGTVSWSHPAYTKFAFCGGSHTLLVLGYWQMSRSISLTNVKCHIICFGKKLVPKFRCSLHDEVSQGFLPYLRARSYSLQEHDTASNYTWLHLLTSLAVSGGLGQSSAGQLF